MDGPAERVLGETMPAAGLSLSLQPCAPHQISVCALHVQVGRRPCVCLDERGIKATPQVAGANRHQVVSCPAAFGRPYTRRPHPSGSTSKQVSCPTANTDEGEKDEGTEFTTTAASTNPGGRSCSSWSSRRATLRGLTVQASRVWILGCERV